MQGTPGVGPGACGKPSFEVRGDRCLQAWRPRPHGAAASSPCTPPSLLVGLLGCSPCCPFCTRGAQERSGLSWGQLGTCLHPRPPAFTLPSDLARGPCGGIWGSFSPVWWQAGVGSGPGRWRTERLGELRSCRSGSFKAKRRRVVLAADSPPPRPCCQEAELSSAAPDGHGQLLPSLCKATFPAVSQRHSGRSGPVFLDEEPGGARWGCREAAAVCGRSPGACAGG